MHSSQYQQFCHLQTNRTIHIIIVDIRHNPILCKWQGREHIPNYSVYHVKYKLKLSINCQVCFYNYMYVYIIHVTISETKLLLQLCCKMVNALVCIYPLATQVPDGNAQQTESQNKQPNTEQ